MQSVKPSELQHERIDDGHVVSPSFASTQECTETDISGHDRLEIEDAATILEFLAWGRREDRTSCVVSALHPRLVLHSVLRELSHQSCIDTAKPRNCRDDDMRGLSEYAPSNTSYSRFFFEIAAFMPRLQGEMTTPNTLYTRYERVLEYDRQMRILATQQLAYYLRNELLESR